MYTMGGYDIYGIDAVEENISLGRELHPEIADKLSVADRGNPYPLSLSWPGSWPPEESCS